MQGASVSFKQDCVYSQRPTTTKSKIVLPLTLYLYQDLDKMVRLMFSCLKSLSNFVVCTEFDFPALTDISNDGISPAMLFMSP